MFPIRDSIPVDRAPIAMLALIAVNTGIFVFQWMLPEREMAVLATHYALVPRRIFDPGWALAHGLGAGGWLTLITNIFMHGGWLHLIFNMWTLYIFGSAVEDRMGAPRFLMFYLMCGLAASLTHAWFNAASTIPALGASGAIAGVTAAYAVAYPTARITVLVPVIIIPFIFTVPALLFALIWFGLQVLQGTSALFAPDMGGGIAWWAHIGGFVAGALLLPMMGRRTRGPWEV